MLSPAEQHNETEIDFLLFFVYGLHASVVDWT